LHRSPNDAAHRRQVDAEVLRYLSVTVDTGLIGRHDLARLKSRFPQAVEIGEPGAIEQWNAGQLPLMLAHPASAGHGLNLQAGGSAVVWFGLTWSNELHLQFNARLHRQGQQRPVVVSYLVADGTVDQDILAALADKHASQEVLLNALRQRAAIIVA
jgi:hypothetical protein